mgnify:CR=1 FL=1
MHWFQHNCHLPTLHSLLPTTIPNKRGLGTGIARIISAFGTPQNCPSGLPEWNNELGADAPKKKTTFLTKAVFLINALFSRLP